MKLTPLDRKHQRELISQEIYIRELPIEELMTWPKGRINPFDQLADAKWIMASDEAKDVMIMAELGA